MALNGIGGSGAGGTATGTAATTEAAPAAPTSAAGKAAKVQEAIRPNTQLFMDVFEDGKVDEATELPLLINDLTQMFDRNRKLDGWGKGVPDGMYEKKKQDAVKKLTELYLDPALAGLPPQELFKKVMGKLDGIKTTLNATSGMFGIDALIEQLKASFEKLKEAMKAWGN